jgi:hypothetical protein
LKGNLALLPILILGGFVLVLTGAAAASRKFMGFIATVITTLLIGSLFFPDISKAVRQELGGFDQEVGRQILNSRQSDAAPKRLRPTFEQIENGDFRFFDLDGKPEVWYYLSSQKKYELFDRPGVHPIYADKLRPVTAEVAKAIVAKMRSAQATSR